MNSEEKQEIKEKQEIYAEAAYYGQTLLASAYEYEIYQEIRANVERFRFIHRNNLGPETYMDRKFWINRQHR